MRAELQRELVGEVLALHAKASTQLAEDVLRIPAAHYTCEDHARREREAWFLGQPHVAGLGGDLPEAGDFFSYEAGRVPIVVVRGPDGVARAFENVCRHRAAPVARGRGHAGRVLACPFHGWSYQTVDGRLVAQPKSCEGFASVDPGQLGLRPLATAERHGLIVVDPRREATLVDVDVDVWLSGLAEEIASHAYHDYLPFRSRSDRWRCNWKLLLDTFFESYHVFALHPKSLAPQYLGIASTAHGFGPHNRLVVPMRSILDLAERPRGEWTLMPHAVVQYFLAPDRILSHYHGVLAVTRFTPISAGETEVAQSLFTAGPVANEAAREALAQGFEFAHAITAEEDYPESERVHRSLESGRVEHTLVGRNEPGVALFHGAIARRIGAHAQIVQAGDRVSSPARLDGSET